MSLQEKHEKKIRILSLGAGVNSTALLVLKALGKTDFDVALFANTGAEHPETYRYLTEVIKPFCENNGISLIEIKREGESLYDWAFSRKIVPSRRFRDCTEKFKIRVLRKYVTQNFPDADKIEFLVGIDAGESHRAKICDGYSYPLIDMGIDRKKCIQIIQEASLPVPIKSGCYICPFTKPENWRKLLKNNPELYAKAEALEKNGSRYPEIVLSFEELSLERIRKGIQNQKPMCDFLPSCPLCELENNESLRVHAQELGGKT